MHRGDGRLNRVRAEPPGRECLLDQGLSFGDPLAATAPPPRQTPRAGPPRRGRNRRAGGSASRGRAATGSDRCPPRPVARAGWSVPPCVRVSSEFAFPPASPSRRGWSGPGNVALASYPAFRLLEKQRQLAIKPGSCWLPFLCSGVAEERYRRPFERKRDDRTGAKDAREEKSRASALFFAPPVLQQTGWVLQRGGSATKPGEGGGAPGQEGAEGSKGVVTPVSSRLPCERRSYRPLTPSWTPLPRLILPSDCSLTFPPIQSTERFTRCRTN